MLIHCCKTRDRCLVQKPNNFKEGLIWKQRKRSSVCQAYHGMQESWAGIAKKDRLQRYQKIFQQSLLFAFCYLGIYRWEDIPGARHIECKEKSIRRT